MRIPLWLLAVGFIFVLLYAAFSAVTHLDPLNLGPHEGGSCQYVGQVETAADGTQLVCTEGQP